MSRGRGAEIGFVRPESRASPSGETSKLRKNAVKDPTRWGCAVGRATSREGETLPLPMISGRRPAISRIWKFFPKSPIGFSFAGTRRRFDFSFGLPWPPCRLFFRCVRDAQDGSCLAWDDHSDQPTTACFITQLIAVMTAASFSPTMKTTAPFLRASAGPNFGIRFGSMATA